MKLIGIASLILLVLGNSPVFCQTLEDQLKQVSPAELVAQAKRDGDAARGAVVFFQATMACSKCHATDENKPSHLGPTLTSDQPDPRLNDESIVEAILEPSKTIRPGFESATVVTANGEAINGLLVERSDSNVSLRDGTGTLRTIPTEDVEQFVLQKQSLMPAGQVNQLTSRQQFMDLVRYLIEIRDGGSERAQQLQPAESLLTIKLPEYESHIDHAGLIGAWSKDSLKRGEAIYRRVCANCHGTKDQIGSLPTSLRFAEGKFKNGSDPLSMYQTLTRGFGLMPAQSWMVPSQKYDVIHYIRETYLAKHNPSQFVKVDPKYLATLPVGNTHGPEPSTIEAWSAMDYGPSLTHCYETPGPKLNIAYKGVAVRLDPGAGGVSRGEQWMVFDTDTMRMAAGWHVQDGNTTEGNGSSDKVRERFIDWRDIQLNGEHGIHPRVVGNVAFRNSNGPGWADPRTGSFVDDQRVEGRDQRRYGPLPREWARFKGVYHHGNKQVFSYSVGNAAILEMPGHVERSDEGSPHTYARTFNIGPRDRDLLLQVAETDETSVAPTYDSPTLESPSLSAIAIDNLSAGIVQAESVAQWHKQDGRLCLKIPAGTEPLRFTIWLAATQKGQTNEENLTKLARRMVGGLPEYDRDLQTLTRGGPARWNQILETKVASMSDSGPLAVEQLVAPEANPWLALMRFSGLDFFTDGSIAACTWDGDVWRITLQDELGLLKWQRIASGLYQPLGLKVVNDTIYLTCRDQLAVLHDLNGDGEMDFYECLNNDHQVTEHFHEFAMGLQVDAEGNFYYAKSGRHALPAVVPHHGTLLRVSSDGSRTDILATGFRAANGVCMNPDGSFVVTDQEGFWNPKNRINWVTLNPNGKPNFYGNMYGYHDVTDVSDTAMEPPLCWITNKFDRSPGELLWVDSPKWGALNGGLLNLSYGAGKVFLVLHEEVNGVHQGGMIQLPIPAFPTGVMRGRFRPQDQQLYLCGMFAWAGDATAPGGLYRVRPTEEPMVLPVKMHAKESGIYLSFTEPLEPESIKPQQVAVQAWSLRRSKNYGSKHFDEQALQVDSASLSADGTTVHLKIDSLKPTWGMEIKFDFKTATGKPVVGTIHNTIHNLAP